MDSGRTTNSGRTKHSGRTENGWHARGDKSALIELDKVVKTFRNAAGEFTVLKGIDAAFREAEFVSIVGRSGSGKSTLLNMMTGIDHPTSGSVRIGDVYLHTLSEGHMSVWRGRNMGIVFQFFQLLPMLTLLENVMLPMDFCEMYDPAEREGRALALLEMVGLHGFEHKYPAAVAGGQQQSAAVARALANDPPILVADEPTGNLDSRTAERVLEIFEEQVANGKTVLLVTHDNSLALRAERRLVISDGELVNEGVSRAFPNLAHGPLLALSHAVEPRSFAEGEQIALDEPGVGLLIVAEGQVEVLLAGGRGEPSSAQRLQPGDIYNSRDAAANHAARRGLRGLIRGREAAVRGLRAVGGPAQVLVLPEVELQAALAASPELETALNDHRLSNGNHAA